MGIYSCKGCTERHPYCHSHCEKYIAEKAEHDRVKAEIDKRNAISFGIQEQLSNSIEKAKRLRKNAYRNKRFNKR